MPLLLFDSALDYLVTIVAGHGYDVGGSSRRESEGEDEIAGLSMPWILAAGSLALITAGVLVWLNPDARKRARAVAPKALIVIIITAPLLAWTASAGGDEKKSQNLMVERSTALTGAPELLISLGEDDMNSLATTNGKRAVRVVCTGRDGQVVIEASKRWPFVNERGYDFPHTHLVTSRAEVQRAESCRLRGTRVLLQADVEGRLPR